jgi:hypothetical protein
VAGAATATEDVRPARPLAAGVRAVVLCLVLFIPYALFGTAVLQGRRQRSLNASTHLRVSAVDIGLDQLVVADPSPRGLRSGPALLKGSGRTGAAAPIVIVGHGITYGGPFRHLTALRPGGQVLLREGAGAPLAYSVEQVVHDPPRNIAIGRGTQALVLETSPSLYHPSRTFAVVARAVGGAETTAPNTIRLAPSAGSTASLALGVILLGALGAGWAWRETFRRSLTRSLSLATRIGAAGLAYAIWTLLLRAAPPLF